MTVKCYIVVSLYVEIHANITTSAVITMNLSCMNRAADSFLFL